VQHGFETTVLTRSASTLTDVPVGVTVAEVDYSSLASLELAIKGQDGVVCTVSALGLSSQTNLIEACVSVGVKHFIPADFASISTDPKATLLPFQAPFIAVQRILQETAAKGLMNYSVIATGLFFEYIIEKGVGIDIKKRNINLFDNGVNPFSATRVETIGKAIAAVFKNWEVVKNRTMFIHDIVLTQAKLLEMAEKYDPQGQWIVNNTTSEDAMQSQSAFAVLVAAIFSGKFDSAYDKVDNELLGLGYMTEDEVEDAIANELRRVQV
jgi:uncharacterized protein YbjT (DUF2867 family)